ncbi:MAG: hypothetical protein NTU53_24430 [Planctomycetota bacterium]|nr:hypothetical protein [Planctomycetota bacterium]
MLWPGEMWDGETARKRLIGQIGTAGKELGLKIEMREEPLHSLEETDAWLAEAKGADGLLMVLLDRQKHAWPSAAKAVQTNTPAVIYSPIGTSFTTNTEPLADKPGSIIYSTDDFGQVKYGMKMLAAIARMRATRCLVIAGSRVTDTRIPDLGIQLRYIPASEFLEMYQKTPENAEILALADELMKGATGMTGATRQDVVNGIKSYVVARTLLEREQADAISMDCLGALGKTKVSLPCIAWAKMNDDGVPAACEADVGAVATHILVQQLFDRPGFQQDPVGDTATDAVIGAHCSCPTRLNGFGKEPERYDIVHHHGKRDATMRPAWKVGQRVTLADVEPGSGAKATRVIVGTGTVLGNVAVPPAGGCVISVRVKFDGTTDVLKYPGFHQLFFYGDYKKQLVDYCKLAKVEALVA